MKTPRSRGQPEFVPTAEQRLMVQIMAANGTPQDVIARNIHRQKGDGGIAEKTLRRAFRQELDCGYADTLSRMGSVVVREGLKGQGWAAKYWLTTHGGDDWKPTENVRHGLTPEATASGHGLVAPVLVIQPVRSINASDLKSTAKVDEHGPIHSGADEPTDDAGPDA